MQVTLSRRAAHYVPRAKRALLTSSKQRQFVNNPKVCDAAIELLRPSLPPPNTCDLVDIQPGNCLWSQKLHEAIQPRRHILVEGEPDLHEDAIVRIIQRFGQDKIKVAADVADLFEKPQEWFSPGTPHYEDRSSTDLPEDRLLRRTHNNQLLLNYNLSASKLGIQGYIGSYAVYQLLQLARSVPVDQTSHNWHKHGLVKMLAWVLESDRTSILPHTAARRYNTSVVLQSTFHMREIAAGDTYDVRRRSIVPWHTAAQASHDQVKGREEHLRLQAPPNRQTPRPQSPTFTNWPDPDNIEPFLAAKYRPPMVDQWLEARKRIRINNPEWLAEFEHNRKIGRNMRVGYSMTDIRKQYAELTRRMRAVHLHYTRVETLVQDYTAIEQDLVDTRRANPKDQTRYLALLEHYKPEIARLQGVLKSYFKDSRVAALKAIDDWRLLYLHPTPLYANSKSPDLPSFDHTASSSEQALHSQQGLAYYTRPYEPVRCVPEDFIKAQTRRSTLAGMVLLYLNPRSDLLDTVSTLPQQAIFTYVCHVMFSGLSVSVARCLDQLYGIGGEGSDLRRQFLDQVPSLTDPLLGGWHDLSDVRARTLRPDQLFQITRVYDQWKYRPDLSTILDLISVKRVHDR